MERPSDQQSSAAAFARGPVTRSRFFGFRDFSDYLDRRVTTSRFGRLFRLTGSGHVSKTPGLAILSDAVVQPNDIQGATFLKEFRAGLTTFTTMAYIIAVNVGLLIRT